MFRWAFICAVVALVAGLLGFSGFVAMSKDFAVILLTIAIILALVSFVAGRRN